MAAGTALEPLSSPGATLDACWECDARADTHIDVPLPLLGEHFRTIRLCGPCYWTHYVPLITQMIEGPESTASES
jgi:hypothetical protein